MTWDHVSSKLGSIRRETRSIAQELYEAAEEAGHEIWFMWGMGSSTEHRTGLALDLMVRNKAGGDFIRDYIWRNRARLRLRHVIWWQRITSTVTRPGVIRKMNDRGNATQNHYDHIHVWFFAGEYQAPQVVEENLSDPEDRPSFSQTQHIQHAVDVETDGKWGPKTDQRVMRMRMAARNKSGYPSNVAGGFDIEDVQSVINTKVDGVWGPNSQSALVRWIENFQHILDVRSDGKWGPKTDGKLITVRRRYLNKY